ncbi:MAG: hypothetical protein IT563_23415 [Alphaproteobacteria bacterium]|nr:hypothetical protein [Alphaproteobacteria bacterium]
MDKANRPVAIQVPYAEWRRIQRLLARRKTLARRGTRAAVLEKHRGHVKLAGDGLAYQKRCRAEWR